MTEPVENTSEIKITYDIRKLSSVASNKTKEQGDQYYLYLSFKNKGSAVAFRVDETGKMPQDIRELLIQLLRDNK